MGRQKRRVIGVDCDDVIIETSPYLIEYCNRIYGSRLEMRHMYSFNLDVWKAASNEEVIDRIEKYLLTDEFQHIAPFEETVASIKRLAGQHELHIVTGRSELLTSITGRMAERYFPGVFRSIEHAGLIGNRARSKGDVCLDIGADLFIDDHILHADRVAEKGIEVFIFGSYPWNQTKTLPKGMTRVQNWPEIEKILS
jgi:uncharacterized HAD superfamily protein